MFDVARGWIFAERRPWILGSVHAGSGRSWQAWWILIEAIEAIEGLIKRSSWNHRFSFVIVKTKEDAGSPSFGPRRGVQSGVAARQIMGQSLSRSELTAPKRRDPDPFGMHLMRDDPWEGSGTRVGPQETPTTVVRSPTRYRGSTAPLPRIGAHQMHSERVWGALLWRRRLGATERLPHDLLGSDHALRSVCTPPRERILHAVTACAGLLLFRLAVKTIRLRGFADLAALFGRFLKTEYY